ncbi:MAG: sigma-70 family RNA polymerase sigma factor [Oscillospiraceae bacterium]|nr:sigma-70 family RNA polymerase sigma factor [Oscillospiraceae bacterium]MDE7278307.1 sigma-70 family RNA polymerase sigma factor [Oscillospiraceae bacterium]
MLCKEEFERIACENIQRLYAHAAVMLRSASDAEDAAEEALYQLFKRKKPFESEEHCRAWLIKVTINASLKILRRRKRFSDDPQELERITRQFEYPEQSELFRAVSGLDSKYKTVVVLYYYENMSVKEIARTLKISATNVTTRLDRARKQLKEILEGSNEYEYFERQTKGNYVTDFNRTGHCDLGENKG